jgi:hypothetical protein
MNYLPIVAILFIKLINIKFFLKYNTLDKFHLAPPSIHDINDEKIKHNNFKVISTNYRFCK